MQTKIAMLEKTNLLLNKVFMCVAGLLMVAMVFLTCANILFRVIWVPIGGTFELMGYFGAVVTAFALGYTQIQKGHVAVDILIQRFPLGMKKILESVNCLIFVVFFSLVAWQLGRYGVTLLKTGEVTETLRIVYYPFTFAVALGCVTLVLTFLTQFLKTVLPTKEGE